jgi:penicillin-binding protein 1A
MPARKTSRKRNKSKFVKLLRPRIIIPGIILVVLFGVFMFVLSVYLGAFGRLHSREDLLGLRNVNASLVYSEEGRIIGRFFSENRTNVSYGQIPPHLKDALIATEDIRFYRHNGIDYRSLMRVLIKSVVMNNPSSGGGSTISQQLVKNLLGRQNFGPLTLPVNKTKEILLAYRIEKALTKEEILTLYLNTVSFGENVYGIGAASWRYFNKRVEYLDISESAVLIGMLKANTFYNPRMHPENAVFRRNVVLRQMEKYNLLDKAGADSLRSLPLALNYLNLETQNPAAYFLVHVKREANRILSKVDSLTGVKWNIEEDGLIINTTLSGDLHGMAMKSFRTHMPQMQKRLENQYSGVAGGRLLEAVSRRELTRMRMDGRANDTIFTRTFNWEGSYNESITVMDSVRKAMTLLHGGLVAIDPESGAVRAWVGGIDFLTQPFDQVLARRQLASAFKPVIFAAAIEAGIDPCRFYDNDSIVLVDYDNWTPVNYDRSYGGRYSLTETLARSLNVPTFNLFLETGFQPVDSMWRKMGFSFPLQYHPSLALGTAEANVLETAIAYAIFANGGYRVSPYTIESILDPDGEVIYQRDPNQVRNRVVSERTCMLMNAMLQKAIDEGTGASLRNVYRVNLPLAGKTGTSQNYADAWFAGYNPGVVIVSRVGASSPTVHFNRGADGSGSALALPLVALALQDIQQDRELRERYAPPFPELPLALANVLDCPDFEQRGVFDRFLDIFKRDRIRFDVEIKKPEPAPAEEQPSRLRRIFRRRN